MSPRKESRSTSHALSRSLFLCFLLLTTLSNKFDVSAFSLSMVDRGTVVVAGATGYIGKSTVRESVRQGYKTVALVRNLNKVESEQGQRLYGEFFKNAEVIECDVSDPKQLEKTMKQIQSQNGSIESVVSCLASRSGIKKEAFEIDYQATLNCLEAGTKCDAKHFVLLSAICVRKPLLQFQLAKLKFEAALQAQSSMTWSIVRPTAFFKSVSGQLERLQGGASFLMFQDSTRCNPIAESDLATYLIDCIADESRRNKIINLGGPDKAMTKIEQGEMLFKAIGAEPKYSRLPVWIFDVSIDVLQWLADVFRSEQLENAAELGRIGKYYAVEDMVTENPEEMYGTISLQEHFNRIAAEGQEYDPYTTMTGILSLIGDTDKSVSSEQILRPVLANNTLSANPSLVGTPSRKRYPDRAPRRHFCCHAFFDTPSSSTIFVCPTIIDLNCIPARFFKRADVENDDLATKYCSPIIIIARIGTSKMSWYPSDKSGACVATNIAGYSYESFPCLYSSTLGKTYFDWEAKYDPVLVRDWMVANPWCPIVAVTLYGVFISLGRSYFSGRPAWNWRNSMALWNLGLSVFSAIGFIRTAPQLLHNLANYGMTENLCFDPESHFGSGATGFWVQLFCLSKIPELIDTFFIVIHKKPLIFLHWYHHISVLLYCWHAYVTKAPAGLFFVTMNYGVHAIMYFYYFLMAVKLKPKWFNSIWITVSQISQMVVGVAVTALGFVLPSRYAKECAIRPENNTAALIMYGSYLLLFVQFFIQRYQVKGGPKKSLKKE